MQNFIGIFDSGIGGLTVLEQLRRTHPNVNFVYVADHAFCPYGTKSFEQIQSRAVAISQYLEKLGASGIVVACNTASVFAKDVSSAVSLPVYNVIDCTCETVSTVTKNKCVALLATDATVKSQVYQRILSTYGIETLPFACSDFVPILENNVSPNLRRDVVKAHLSTLPTTSCDTVILGCTHFPLLLDEILPYVGTRQIVSCSKSMAIVLPQDISFGSGETQYFTTGDCEKVNVVAQKHFDVNFSHVDI